MQKVLHLSIKEKEHFCSCFLTYHSCSKHIFIYGRFYEELEGLSATNHYFINYYAMSYKEKVLRKENNHPSSSYC